MQNVSVAGNALEMAEAMSKKPHKEKPDTGGAAAPVRTSREVGVINPALEARLHKERLLATISRENRGVADAIAEALGKVDVDKIRWALWSRFLPDANKPEVAGFVSALKSGAEFEVAGLTIPAGRAIEQPNR